MIIMSLGSLRLDVPAVEHKVDDAVYRFVVFLDELLIDIVPNLIDRHIVYPVLG